MPLIGSSGTRLRSSNSVSHFANLTPKHSSGSWIDGLIGIFRILATVGEVIGSFAFPEFAPFIVMGGSALQESMDLYSFFSEDFTTRSELSFGLSTLVNVVPAGFAFRGIKTASKSVLRIAETGEEGFRYLIKGIDAEFNEAFQAVSSGINFEGKEVSRISIHRQKLLINKGTLPNLNFKRVARLYGMTGAVNENVNFERSLQATFSNREAAIKTLSGYRGQRYYVHQGEHMFSNRDLAIIRREIKFLAKGQRTEEQIIRKFNSLSMSAQDALGMSKWVDRRSVFSNLADQKYWMKQMHILSNVYNRQLYVASTVQEKGLFKRIYHWFGTESSANRKAYKSGRFWTQAAQLANPNDMAREMLNKPTSFILNGFKRTSKSTGKVFEWKGLKKIARGWNKEIDKKLPKALKALKGKVKGSKLLVKYNKIKKGLAENGTTTLDTTYLMGWRTIESTKAFSEVIFYFNPLNTSAKTPGSLNFGGKKPIHRTIPTNHLKALKNSSNPGNLFLKGGIGFPPVALSPGGRRPVNQVIEGEALALLGLTLSIGPLRNILSVISNFKNVITSVAQGTYKGKWANTFVGTFRRLWVNKITRIMGHTVGNIMSQEAGSHIGRIFKTVGQGFQHTSSRTVMINGRRVVERKTTFSFGKGFNWRPLVKQAMPQTARSATIRRVPRTSGGRENLKLRRYGTNIRRIPGIGTSFLK